MSEFEMKVLGRTLEQRYQTLLERAVELGKTGQLSSHSWRRDFARKVAATYKTGDKRADGKFEDKVYNSIAAFSPEQTKAIRVACIGPDEELVFVTRNAKREKTMRENPTKGSPVRRSDVTSIQDLEATYRAKIGGLDPAERTIERLTKALGAKPIIVKSFLYTHEELAAQLMDGPRLFKRGA